MIAAAAPVILEAGSAGTPASTPAHAPPSGFDAILLLQSLAATTETQSAFEAGDTAEALATEDGDDEDVDDEIESSLAFLTTLINAAPRGSSNGSAGGSETGSGEPPEDENASLPALALKADTGFALNGEADPDRSELLANLAAAPPEPLEARAGDASQNPATRGAELFAQAQRPAGTPVAQATVSTPARDPRWADDFGARVSLMVRANESAASLQLTPVDLGPVEVNVTVKDSQATIHFGASQAETRALIEASLPRLRELLASQGFNLTDASVSSGFSRSQQQEFASGSRGTGEGEAAATEVLSTRPLGLLDLYA